MKMILLNMDSAKPIFQFNEQTFPKLKLKNLNLIEFYRIRMGLTNLTNIAHGKENGSSNDKYVAQERS